MTTNPSGASTDQAQPGHSSGHIDPASDSPTTWATRVSSRGLRHRLLFGPRPLNADSAQTAPPPATGVLPDHASVRSWVRLLRSKRVSWLPDTDPPFVERLAREGIYTIGDLVDHDPAELSQVTGINEGRLDALRSVVRFLAVPGMERRSASLLVGLGLRDWPQFFSAEAPGLAERLNALDVHRHGTDRLYRYNECTVERWQVLAQEFGADHYRERTINAPRS